MTKEVNLAELAQTVALLYDTLYTPAPPAGKIWEEHLTIREVIEKVEKSQKSAAEGGIVKSERTAEDLEQFLKWCDEQKILHEAVEVVPCSNHDGYGLRAKGDIPKDADIVAIPREAMIDIERIRNSPSLKRVVEEDPQVRGNHNVAIALFLCSEKLEASSSFAHYIRFLPSTNPVPLYFSTDDLQKLKPSPCFDDALIFYRTIVRQYCHFLLEVVRKEDYQRATEEERKSLTAPSFTNTPFTVHNFTWELFRWAVSTVTCRVNSIPSTTESDPSGYPRMILSMIPFLDLANHENRREISCAIAYKFPSNRAVLTTSREYKTGEEVEMFYGNRSSADYMVHNGFIPAGGVDPDFYELKLSFAKGDSLAPAKMVKLEQIEKQKQWEPSHSKKYIFKTYVFPISNGPSPIPENLKVFVKLFMSNTLEEEVLKSKELEKKTAEWLRNRIQILLMNYKPAEYVTPTEKTIEQLHLCEKDLLKRALDFCTKWFEAATEEIIMVEELEKRYKKKELKPKKAAKAK